MKRKSDPRHSVRVSAFKSLFAASFKEKKAKETTLPSQILGKAAQIDKLIKKNAPAWPIEQIAPTDLAVLRLAIYELLFKENKQPYKVIVDEAVEIAKEYGNKKSGSFINGVLGAIIKNSKINN